MNTINNETTLNNEQEVHSEENGTVKTPSAKDKVMEDGKLTFWEILYVARYFLPVLTTIGWILIFLLAEVAPNTPDVIGYIILSVMALGFISALTVSPLKFIKFIFTSTIKGFHLLRSFIPFYGVADLVAAIFGTTFGFMFGAIVVFGLPAVFTITKFFNEDSFQ